MLLLWLNKAAQQKKGLHLDLRSVACALRREVELESLSLNSSPLRLHRVPFPQQEFCFGAAQPC